MNESAGRNVSRRDAVTTLGSAGVALAGRTMRWWGRELLIQGRAAEVAVAAVSRTTLRISVLPAGARGSRPIPLDGAIVDTAWVPQGYLSPGTPGVSVGSFGVSVSADPVTVRIARADGRQVQELRVSEASGAVEFLLGERPVLGMGQGGPQFDRRGAAHQMRSGQAGYQLRTHGGVVPVQWMVSTDGWALYIHHPLGTFDLTGHRGRFDPPADTPLSLDAFLVVSDTPAEIMGEWARLTGRPEMPPRWAFGYHQSHRTLSGPQEVLDVARTFREKRLPCDTLIYLGTGFTPSGWNTQNGEFTWNPASFPDPEATLAELHAMHFRVVVHVVLEGRRLTGTVADPCPNPPAPGEAGSGRDWPDEQRVSCYWPIHARVFAQGVDGWWPDQGDGLDAESRLARIRMYWEGTQQLRPGERPFALHRNGYTGMARYAAFLWSGDVQSRWETLRTHVPVAINAGLSGIPYWGTDIGGFVATDEYTGELYVRWFQFGAFCPLFRSHGRTWHLRLPWGWNTGEMGPNEVANWTGPAPHELRNAAVEPICKQYLELRYRLLPYLYTAVRQVHDTGLPIMRSLWLHYPDDPVASARGDEYLWGRDLLVAPVTEKGATSRSLYLPAGAWYDFWTEEPVLGGREVERVVDLATTPLYVRAGAIVPFGPVTQYTAEPIDGSLTVVVYPGMDGAYTLYEDDGLSFAYQGDGWTGTVMRWDDRERTLQLSRAPAGRLGRVARTIEVRVAGSAVTRTVAFAGEPMVVRL